MHNKEYILKVFVDDPCKAIIKDMFWLVFINTFSGWREKTRLSAELNKNIGRNYCAMWQGIDQPIRDFCMDVLTLLIGIQVYTLFNTIFKSDQKMFGNRFMLDCIHFCM